MEPLRELLRYHAWATRALIDHCAALSPEVLGATVPGTAGTIMEMLVHLAAAEGRYLAAFGGPAPDQAVREGTDAALDLIRGRAQEHAARWETLLDRAGHHSARPARLTGDAARADIAAAPDAAPRRRPPHAHRHHPGRVRPARAGV